jgi:hypothetical protein
MHDLYSNSAIESQMSRLVDVPHASASQTRFKSILIVERSADQRINERLGIVIGLDEQWREIIRANLNVRRVVLSACGTIDHQLIVTVDERALGIIA